MARHAVVKKNGKFHIRDEFTDELVYSLPNFCTIPSRNVLRDLAVEFDKAFKLNRQYPIDAVTEFETKYTKLKYTAYSIQCRTMML